MLKDKCAALAELKRKIDAEETQRIQIRASDAFTELGKQISALMEKQDELLAHVPNSQADYDALSREVMELMKTEGIYAVGDVKAKLREKNEVNTSKVLQVIGGDMDIFVTLASITQTKLKDFAKTSGMKELMDCVETVSRDVVGISIDSPVLND